MFPQKMLRDAIFAKGVSAVASFVGMEIRPGATQEEMNDLFAQAYAQMPEDILANYEAQYLDTVQAKITHRILLQGHIQGYVLECQDGTSFRARMQDIVFFMKSGMLTLENATVARNHFGWDGLRGKKCSLAKLPAVTLDWNEPMGYHASHTWCIKCHNRGAESICSACMAADDGRGSTY